MFVYFINRQIILVTSTYMLRRNVNIMYCVGFQLIMLSLALLHISCLFCQVKGMHELRTFWMGCRTLFFFLRWNALYIGRYECDTQVR